VSKGAKLTVNNAVIKFAAPTASFFRNLSVEGTFECHGSLFTSVEDSGPDQWHSLELTGSAEPHSINKCEFRHGGPAVTIGRDAVVSIVESSIHDNSDTGIGIGFPSTTPGASVTIQATTIENNGGVGISVSRAQVFVFDSVITGNETGMWFNMSSLRGPSTISNSIISDNLGYGIDFYYSAIAGLVVTDNTITNNNGGEPVQVQAVKMNFMSTWTGNDFGGTYICPCPFEIESPIKTFTAYWGNPCFSIGKDPPPEGPITTTSRSMTVEGKTVHCRVDHVPNQ
jgi:hypothetical protein